ncbi:glycosyltransferase family 2 protein [Agrococcus terreus]|uniref:glycosyltransferase family 2 protein n=1 Tax=Agrococcus terreus TaxID=574649 RepID=UPI0038502D34
MAQPWAIVVVSFGSSALLEQHLVATADGSPDALVVVVDNRSTDRERERVRALAAERGWHLVAMAGNPGFGGGANAGIGRALELGARAVLLLNPDARIGADGVAALRAAGGPLSLRSPLVRSPDGRTWFSGLDLDLVDGEIRSPHRRAERPDGDPMAWLSGACLWIEAPLWALVGGFDDDYFLYWEDVDLSRRVLDAGGELLVVEAATAWHDEGGTHRERGARAEAKSELYYFWNIRNRMLFAAKHLDPEGIRRWRRAAPGAAWRILLRGGRRQLLRPVPPLRALVRGLSEGSRIAREALASGGGTRS